MGCGDVDDATIDPGTMMATLSVVDVWIAVRHCPIALMLGGSSSATRPVFHARTASVFTCLTKKIRHRNIIGVFAPLTRLEKAGIGTGDLTIEGLQCPERGNVVWQGVRRAP